MEYTLETGRFGVDMLFAPYALLVEAFGNDGINPRDTYKSMCQWESDPASVDAGLAWEVYDYKVGICYAPDGLEREEITEWHVQSTEAGKDAVRALLDAAVARIDAELTAARAIDDQEKALSAVVGELVADHADYADEVNELGDGGTVYVGEVDEDQFFVDGGLEISLAGVRLAIGNPQLDMGGEVSVGLSLAEIRKAHALLGAYLAIKDDEAAR